MKRAFTLLVLLACKVSSFSQQIDTLYSFEGNFFNSATLADKAGTRVLFLSDNECILAVMALPGVGDTVCIIGYCTFTKSSDTLILNSPDDFEMDSGFFEVRKSLEHDRVIERMYMDKTFYERGHAIFGFPVKNRKIVFRNNRVYSIKE